MVKLIDLVIEFLLSFTANDSAFRAFPSPYPLLWDPHMLCLALVRVEGRDLQG